MYWYEYALRYHGSKTVLFALYLLVDSVREAESCLRSQGWEDANLPSSNPQFYDPAVDEHVVLGRGDDIALKVVLISSHNWPGIVPPTDDRDEAHYPSLPQLYSALAHRFLDTDCPDFRRYLLIQIDYLCQDCPALASPTFVTERPSDIQQFHLDWRLRSLSMLRPETIQHLRDIRARARRGEWTLMYEGTADLGGWKIDRTYEGKLVAMMQAREAARSAGQGTE
ncbi:hypothetical protein K466DRAFT_584752 [Polyporus arcularius HHB13444]|uniref:Uncharacterized protein n=1 Tax=Polyporus arcularius HHB13444 TaxID=1314778 RepID=A0A5C3PHN0_9APHY|nr:hypothetical protein K466DRAFT_584752 [Polyporus arcularius HHB13444]